MNQLSFFGVVLILYASGSTGESPLVKTGLGKLRGKFEISRNGIQYEAYLGIRFAEIPHRFDESQPRGTWHGVKDATKFGMHCAQESAVGTKLTGSEDCLYLNVFTPKTDNMKRAVMVFIHGGGFNQGSSSEFGGSYLVDEDVVLVTLNYRLGVLGFLNTGDGVAVGNMGLKDQVLALKWVKENIEYFGGDKNRVTISGNSAGAASVLHLMSSPLAQGLFSGIYAMSGNTLAHFAYTDNNAHIAAEMGVHLNCHAKNTMELVSCFRRAPFESLIAAQKSIQRWVTDFFRMRPSLEVKSAWNPNPFLDEKPEERLWKGNWTKVPVILTMTPDEGVFAFSALLVRNPPLLKVFNNEYASLAPITFDYDVDPILKHCKDKVAKAILDFYFAGQPITAEREANLTNVYTDAFFAHSIHKTAHILGGHTSVYVGLFAHDRTDFSPLVGFGIHENVDGVAHTEDLSYLFNPTGMQTPTPLLAEFTQETDIEFSKKFVNVIANFAKTGTPTISFGRKPVWSPVTRNEIESNSLNWLNLDHDVFVHQDPFKGRMAFWDNLYKEAQSAAQKSDL